jgi:hypothetical protein
MQAFAGYFRVNTGRVQFLQMPVILLILYCFPPDFIRPLPMLRAIATYSRWLSCWQL